MSSSTAQLLVIHLSDVHFGPSHRFRPTRTAAGDVPEDPSHPRLLDKLVEDLEGEDPGCPVILCLTGDLTETGSAQEFDEAEAFIEGLAQAELLGKARGRESIFVVPGNHDVLYTEPKLGLRWQQWADFYRRAFGQERNRDDSLAFVELHDRVDDLGALILCLNSAVYVRQGAPDEDRGRLDTAQLTKVENALDAIDADRLRSAIRIALIHHHPILIPSLAEAGRGYDAVHNSGMLLSCLRRHGFHAVLHGHKHDPHTFTEDVHSAHQTLPQQPLFVAAGGSVGSVELPYKPGLSNGYNRLMIKWHSAAGQSRVQATTRSLRIFNEDGTERLASLWNWTTARVEDRHFLEGPSAPLVNEEVQAVRAFDAAQDAELEAERVKIYETTRGNMAVAAVMPSLEPGQAYEVRLWIEPHKEAEPPVSVRWSAGELFEVITVKAADDPRCCTALDYWGPMLVQAALTFADGETALSHIYARMPRDYNGQG